MIEYLEKLMSGGDLEFEEAADVMNQIMSGKVAPARIAAFLVALKIKGETVEEVAGLAATMRERALGIDIDPSGMVDTCGTGGDGSGTFNISTAAAIVTAAAGLKVAKHGNRSMSSSCGSADLLEAFRIKIDGGSATVKKSIDEIGIGFMFAPVFHPAMKYAVTPRKELGLRTVFNILGPLTNPAGVRHQALGVFSPDMLEIMVNILARLGSKRVIAFSSEDGLDELSLEGDNYIVELDGVNQKKYKLTAVEVGLKTASTSQLRGGGPEENMIIIHDLLAGKEGPCLDAVAFNAGAAIYIGGKTDTIAAGVELARETIISGRAAEKLAAWIAFSRTQDKN